MEPIRLFERRKTKMKLGYHKDAVEAYQKVISSLDMQLQREDLTDETRLPLLKTKKEVLMRLTKSEKNHKQFVRKMNVELLCLGVLYVTASMFAIRFNKLLK